MCFVLVAGGFIPVAGVACFVLVAGVLGFGFLNKSDDKFCCLEAS